MGSHSCRRFYPCARCVLHLAGWAKGSADDNSTASASNAHPLKRVWQRNRQSCEQEVAGMAGCCAVPEKPQSSDWRCPECGRKGKPVLRSC